MAVNQFDSIAPFYDRLATLIFKNSIHQSQLVHLNAVRPSDNVLIIGGGSGQLLEHFPDCHRIDFTEMSGKMLTYAKRRASKNKVNFIQEDFFDVTRSSSYDIIICPFFLDCFSQSNLEKALDKIKSMISSRGKLIVSDFDKKNTTAILTWGMHAFFKIFSNLESNRLNDIHQTVLNQGFSMEKELFFHRNMIFSRLYRNL